MPPKEEWTRNQFHLKLGQDLDLDEILASLVTMGYARAGMVSAPGEFSLRGGIIDIYPLTEEYPVRIELFDTEIDSIRTFNSEDQRSIEKLKEIHIGPAEELVVDGERIKICIEKLEQALAYSLKRLKDDKQKEILAENIGYELEQLRNGQFNQEMVKYLTFFYEQPASLLDYFPEQTIVVMDEISRIQEMYESLEKDEADWYTSLLEHGKIVNNIKLSHDYSDVLTKTKHPLVYLSLFVRHVPHTSPQNILNVSCKQMQNFHGQMNVLKSEIERWKKANFSVVFLGATEERVKKLEAVLSDYEINAAF